jgi:hypothetical protein
MSLKTKTVNLGRNLILKTKSYKRKVRVEKPLGEQSTEELIGTMANIFRQFTAVGYQRWHGAPSSKLYTNAQIRLKALEDFLKAKGRKDLLVVLADEKKKRGISP